MGYKENPQLANWVSTQRQEWKLRQAGMACRINDEKIAKLDQLDFSWEAVRGGKRKKRSTAASADGETGIITKKKRGSGKKAKTAVASIEEGVPTIEAAQEATENLVQTIPEASAPAEESWTEMYDALLQFKAKTGHTNVTLRYKDKPGLASWVTNQRREYGVFKELAAGIADDPNTTCVLTEERVGLLESIEFDFKITRKPGRPAKAASTPSVAEAVTAAIVETGNLKKTGDDDEMFVDAVEIMNEEGAKDEKTNAVPDLSSKKRVRKNIPKGNAVKANTEVVGGVKDAAEMLFSLGGA